jgi:hypothetical protein
MFKVGIVISVKLAGYVSEYQQSTYIWVYVKESKNFG